MQPYLFPYLGYFQLVHAVDKFVVLDDVNFIKQGWVNRNRILMNGEPHLFTLPVKKASSFTAIHDLGLDPALTAAWRQKFLRTMAQAYKGAPHVRQVLEWLEQALAGPFERLVDLLVVTLRGVFEHIGLRTELVLSARGYDNRRLTGQARIIDICMREGADRYVNMAGGKELYHHDAFGAQGVALSFLRSRLPAYPQGRHAFVPGLSILDAMMFLGKGQLLDMMEEYDLE